MFSSRTNAANNIAFILKADNAKFAALAFWRGDLYFDLSLYIQ